MRQTGLVESCSPTSDGRFLIVVKIGKNRFHGYSVNPSVVGGTATVENGVVV